DPPLFKTRCRLEPCGPSAGPTRQRKPGMFLSLGVAASPPARRSFHERRPLDFPFCNSSLDRRSVTSKLLGQRSRLACSYHSPADIAVHRARVSGAVVALRHMIGFPGGPSEVLRRLP